MPGISSYTFPWLMELQNASIAAKAIYLVQVAGKWNVNFVQFGDNLPLHKLSDPEKDHLCALADEHSIQLQVGTCHLSTEKINTYLEIAVRFKSPFIRVVIDEGVFRPSEGEVKSVIRNLLPGLKKTNIVLAIENHDRFPSAVLKNIILETDPSVVGICLDTANSIGCNEGLEQTVTILAPFTVNLHVKDFSIRRVPSKMGFIIEGTPAGNGSVNIPWVVSEVKRYGTCSTATLEVWSGKEETPELTITREYNWAQEGLAYLKNILN